VTAVVRRHREQNSGSKSGKDQLSSQLIARTGVRGVRKQYDGSLTGAGRDAGSWGLSGMAREHSSDRLEPAALLVAGSEQLVTKTAASGATRDLPQIEGLECRQVAPGVIRAAISPGAVATAEEAAQRLLRLRGRLDRLSVASAIEWAAESSAANRGSEAAGMDPTAGGSNVSLSTGTAPSRSSRGPDQRSEQASLDDDHSREVLRQASDEDLAHEMLRRARNRGIGTAEPRSDATAATQAESTAA
jgi:hypothetical protein